MTALDTNVLVRYRAQDDKAQFQKVLRMLNRKPATFDKEIIRRHKPFAASPA